MNEPPPSKVVELASREDPPSETADITLSNKFCREYGRDLHYVAKMRMWFIYDDAAGLWSRDSRLRVWTWAKQFCVAYGKELYDLILSENPKHESTAQAIAKECAAASKVAAVISLARSYPGIAVEEDAFDSDHWLLNTAGGRAFNLHTGKSRPATREDLFTKSTPVTPREMPTPQWDDFIRVTSGLLIPPNVCACAACQRSAGKPDDQRHVLHLAEVERIARYRERVYGYALTGDVSEEKLFLQIGDGGNGKGVMNDVMMKSVFGEYPRGYSCEIPIEALLVPKGAPAHPTELMDLWHTRLALSRESDADTRWNEGRVKRLTGQDRVKARLMRQDFVEFWPTHKLIMFGNERPTLRDGGQAAWKRRISMDLFQQLFDEAEDPSQNILKADKGLRDKLAAEAPGILHKLIQACLEWQKNGLDAPESVRAAGTEYLSEQNIVARWVEERIDQTNPWQTITVGELWIDYCQWCTRNYEEPGKRTSFNANLERAGIHAKRRAEARGICEGVGLKTRSNGEETS